MHAYFCVYYMENYICIHTQGVNRYIVYVHIHKCILIGTCLLIYQYIFLNMYYYTHILFLKQPAKSTRCNFFIFPYYFIESFSFYASSSYNILSFPQSIQLIRLLPEISI